MNIDAKILNNILANHIINTLDRSYIMALAYVDQLVGVSSHRPKYHGFDSQSDHVPRSQVQFPIGTCMRRQTIDVSLASSLFLKAMKKMYLGENEKNFF